MLTRRSAGVALLVAVVLGSLVLARIGGARIGGTAIAEPGQDLKAVGECLTSVNGPPPMPLLAALPPSPLSVVSLGAGSVTFDDCSVDHVGEVVANRTVPGPGASGQDATAGTGTSGTGAASGTSTASAAAPAISDGQWCQTVAATYRELSQATFGDDVRGGWEPATGQRFVTILSTPTLDAAAPRWAACAFLSPRLELYAGSYVRSLANLPAPAPFGLCRTGDSVDRRVSCAGPHRVQEFGTAAAQGFSSQAAQDSCRALIERMTRMSDVTAGGVLQVQVVGGAGGDRPGGFAGAPGSTALAAVATCRLSVIGDARLVGTLVGIGNRQLPMS